MIRLDVVRAGASLLVASAMACSPAGDRQRDTASAAAPQAPATPAANPTPAAWTVSDTAAGPIRPGMTIAEAAGAIGGSLPDTSRLARVCDHVWFPGAPPGVSAMIVEGRVARINIDSAGVETDRGARIGDGEARLQAMYAPRLTIEPHKYVDGGHYLIVRPESRADSTLRLIFETDGARVTRYRVGRLPEVRWVEGCS